MWCSVLQGTIPAGMRSIFLMTQKVHFDHVVKGMPTEGLLGFSAEGLLCLLCH